MATKKAAKKATKTTRSARAVREAEGPLYRVLKQSQINDAVVDAGAQVVYYGLPGKFLQPLNDEAKSRKAQVAEIRNDTEITAEEKQAELKALSDEWNGVEGEPSWDDVSGLADAELPDGERKALESHAQQTVDDTAEAQEEDTNFTKIKLQGRLKETDASKQGATPVTDGKK